VTLLVIGVQVLRMIKYDMSRVLMSRDDLL